MSRMRVAVPEAMLPEGDMVTGCSSKVHLADSECFTWHGSIDFCSSRTVTEPINTTQTQTSEKKSSHTTNLVSWQQR